jgi:small subunit ribosomal protein S20
MAEKKQEQAALSKRKLPKGRYLSSIRAARKSQRRYLFNKWFKTRAKEAIKEFKQYCEEKNQQKAKELLAKAFSILDKLSKHNIFHKNKVARKKRQLSLLYNRVFAAP